MNKRTKLTDTENNVVVTREKGAEVVKAEGGQIYDDGRLDFGW